MARYELSQAADKEFEDILNFGIDTFGFEQALEYQRGMEQRLQLPFHILPDWL